MTAAEFRELLERVAEAWRRGDARTGADLVRIVDGKIANWREYQHRSELAWDEFVGPNRF
jgi:hypothetical protein